LAVRSAVAVERRAAGAVDVVGDVDGGQLVGDEGSFRVAAVQPVVMDGAARRAAAILAVLPGEGGISAEVVPFEELGVADTCGTAVRHGEGEVTVDPQPFPRSPTDEEAWLSSTAVL